MLPLAAVAALLLSALPALAWNPWASGNGGFGPGPYPPSYYGYPLDDYSAGYYGGSRYREYYAYGRGFGVADMPGPVPGPIYPYGYRFPRLEPQMCTMPMVMAPVAVDPGCALLDVSVPDNAEVWLEGAATKQTGVSRQFVSPPLKTGHDYHYEIKARWKQDGRDVEETREVNVHAGERLSVTFPTASQKVSVPNALPTDVSQ
jgi:uncharacterized protein (TIGR03000 family)